MSVRNWQLRAEDIFESIQNIRTYTEGMDYPTWREDKKTIDAVVRNFEIIGEAAKSYPGRYPIPISPYSLAANERNTQHSDP